MRISSSFMNFGGSWIKGSWSICQDLNEPSMSHFSKLPPLPLFPHFALETTQQHLKKQKTVCPNVGGLQLPGLSVSVCLCLSLSVISWAASAPPGQLKPQQQEQETQSWTETNTAEMGLSWDLVCSSAFVLVLLSSASGEEHKFEQREVTDFSEVMLQRPVDFKELLKDLRPQMTPRGRQASINPSSFKEPVERYPVQFPLGRPTSDNLEAICLYGDRRPRYPDSYFPLSGFGSQVRRGKAVNEAESFLSTCCERRQTWELEVTLCCATQAWELSIESFCNEEFSIKTSHYFCCRLDGTKRLNCFHSNAPNPNYEPTEEIPVPPLPSTTTDKFVFDPNTCQREMKSPTSHGIGINFPPGRPTADTIKSLCHNQMFRPLYNVKCLLGSGNKLLAHQAKTINHMEKGFEQCCKKQGMLDCADRKWREEIDKFCLGKKGGQVDFPCCLGERTNDRYNCFQQTSPDPYYNMTSGNRELSLNKICDAQKIIKKMFPLQSFMDQCCPLSDQDEMICSEQKLEEMLGSMCSSRREGRSYPAVRRCCRGPAQETPQCASKILMDVITKSTSLSRQKKKKCPIS